MSELTIDANTTIKLSDINNKGEIIGYLPVVVVESFHMSPEKGVVALILAYCYNSKR